MDGHICDKQLERARARLARVLPSRMRVQTRVATRHTRARRALFLLQVMLKNCGLPTCVILW
jgi:hypothetical protein